MQRILVALGLPFVLLAAPLAVWAGGDDEHDHRHYKKHGHGHGHHHRHERKQEFWDGPCKVEREWKKNGEYKEKRKCKDHGPVGYYQPRPVYVQPPPPPVYLAPRPPEGLVIQSQIEFRR